MIYGTQFQLAQSTKFMILKSLLEQLWGKFKTIFPDNFPIITKIPDISKIPRHFQVFQKSGLPENS